MKLFTATAAFLFTATTAFAQIENEKTETVKIYGNCGMCESTIEKAGNVKNVAKVDWNKDTKTAVLVYNADKTSKDEILKRIALAGYDSDAFLAPDDVYAKLPGCCQYERANKTAPTTQTMTDHSGHNMADMTSMTNKAKPAQQGGHCSHSQHTMAGSSKAVQQQEGQLQGVFNNYFLLKDALVQTDANAAAINAGKLLTAINAVQMNALGASEHTAWMNMKGKLATDAEKISTLKDAAKQRTHFAALSENMYELIKVTKPAIPVYYQSCPMFNGGKGANWLSKENTIKNPYYGSKMLGCGSVKETISVN